MVEPYIIGALLAVVMFSIGAILVKYIIPEMGSPYHFLIIQLSFSLVVFLFIFGIYSYYTDPKISSVSGNSLVLLILASLFSFAGYFTYIAGLEIGKASLGGIFLSSRVFISVPLAILIVGEHYPPLTFILIFIALLGAITVSWEPGLSIRQILLFRAKGIRLFSATAFFWSLGNFFVRQLGDSIPLVTFLTARQAIFTLLAVIVFLVRFGHFPKFSVKQLFLTTMLLYIFLSVIAQFLFVYAISQSLGITETIGIFEGTMTFILSLLFAKLVGNEVLEETLQLKSIGIRFVGAVLAVIGTFGVTIIN